VRRVSAYNIGPERDSIVIEARNFTMQASDILNDTNPVTTSTNVSANPPDVSAFNSYIRSMARQDGIIRTILTPAPIAISTIVEKAKPVPPTSSMLKDPWKLLKT